MHTILNSTMGITCGKEWASSLDKIIAGRSNVYARDSDAYLAHFSPGNNLTKKVRRIILELSNRQLRPFSILSKIKEDIQYLWDML
jgi:hypothetical protein